MIKIENIFIALYGIITVIVFILMLTFGGLFNSLHSLYFQEISYLISPYSSNHEVAIPLYRLYNLCLLLFSILLILRFQNIFAKIGAMYLVLSAVSSLLLVEVPMDPLQFSHSYSGLAHILIAMLTVVYIVSAMVLFGYTFRKNRNLSFVSKYSFVISIIVVCGGLLSGIFALLNMSAYVGIIEKLPIIAFLVWISMTAIWVLQSDKRIHYKPVQ